MKISICFILLIISINIFSKKEIWVSPYGSDSNNGSKEKPLLSINIALRKAREMRRIGDTSVNDGIFILLDKGCYNLYEPLLIRPEDSGTENSPTIIKSSTDELSEISGGIEIKNWKLCTEKVNGLPKEAQNKIWTADIPKIGGRYLQFRQLWINNKKASRASTLNDGTLSRIISVNKEKEEILIPRPKFEISDVSGLEFVIHQWWAIAILRVKSISTEGDKAKVTFWQPESRIEFEHPWPAPFIDNEKKYNGNSAFYFVNAIQLLNKPGEWYADMQKGKIYYWPDTDEDINKSKVIAPYLENILLIEGNIDNKVKYINFDNIIFEHTGWLRPSYYGHVPLQAGMYIIDAYKLEIPGTPDKASLENQAWTGRQSSAISIKNAKEIKFHNCIFRNLAATAVDFISGSNFNSVDGCLFYDIGGTAIQIGFFGNEGFEAHLPYNPSDERELCHNITITNNYITNCTNEDWGCVGISVGYAHDINIGNNELSNLNYSGICVGWGWTKTISCMRNNKIYANKIHDFAKNMYDVGGIYTLSAQPNTAICNNYIYDLIKAPYAHIPEHYQYIYLDEGSSYIIIKDNWTEKDKFFSNTPGPGNEWINNGPHVSEEIKKNAGPLNQYFDFLYNNKYLNK